MSIISNVTVNENYLKDPVILYSIFVKYFHETPWYFILRDYIYVQFCYKFLNTLWFNIYAYGPVGSIKLLYKKIAEKIFQNILQIPSIKVKVDKEVYKTRVQIEKELIKTNESLTTFDELPKFGLPDANVLNILDRLIEVIPHSDWENGKVSGAVYHGGHDLVHLQSQAFEKYCISNQLHPDVFPALRKMEAEVVSMVLKMFNAPESTGCGTTTSGGTESLLLACLSAKMHGLRNKGITEPEMIIPKTAHAGFDKAGYYFGIKIHHVELDPISYKVDIKQMSKFINKNTVLLVGSVPNFPHGIADDIEAISKLAIKYDIPLHVDCCLGSFIVAFMEKAGLSNGLPSFDFRVPGVTSISCDTHKYGFAPKGSSILMYRNEELRMQQYYVDPNWVGGLYGSPTLAGSRPGALIAGCWATMIKMGEIGYIESCKEIIFNAKKLKQYIMDNLTPTLEIIGDPQFSVISFKSKVIDVYTLSDKLNQKGWHLSCLQKPAALHLAVTKLSIKSIDELCHDLSEAVNEMLNDPNHLDGTQSDTSALYGVAGSVKTTGVVDKLIVGFIDALYKLQPSE